jgi:hypothetical protein
MDRFHATTQAADNPKHIRAMKDGKTPFEYLVWDVLASEAAVLAHGGEKYGARNWRLDEIMASTYEGSIMRHFLAWCMGEDIEAAHGSHPRERGHHHGRYVSRNARGRQATRVQHRPRHRRSNRAH